MGGSVTDKRRIVQVGLGGWGWSWTRIIQASAEFELAAVVDLDRQRLAASAKAYGPAENQLHTSLADAIKASGADTCLVVVPPEAHAPVAIDAMRQGLHCLVEKPIADTVASAKAMIAAARDHGVTLMVNQNYRFRRTPRTVRKLMADGIIGRPGSIHIAFQKSPKFGGFREKMAHPLLLDMAIHHFDLLRGIVGFEPSEASASSWNPPWSWFDGDACANAVFRSADGATAVYHGSWVSRGWQTSWDGDWRIQGDEGEIHWAENEVNVLPTSVFTSVFVPGARETRGRLAVDLLQMDAEDRHASLREFAHALAENRPAETSGDDNLKTLATVLATRLSIERRVPVTLEEVLS
jgi:predicted dehydrogenase